MPVTLLTPIATEQSTYAVAISFFDEVGTAVTPNAGLTWTLTDSGGAVINSRSAVAIAAATVITIVLHGADLAITGGLDDRARYLTVSGTYNSSLGTNLELRDQVKFTLNNLVGV
jgi:hypothetical protein